MSAHPSLFIGVLTILSAHCIVKHRDFSIMLQSNVTVRASLRGRPSVAALFEAEPGAPTEGRPYRCYSDRVYPRIVFSSDASKAAARHKLRDLKSSD